MSNLQISLQSISTISTLVKDKKNIFKITSILELAYKKLF